MSDWLTLPDRLLEAHHSADVGKHYDPAVLAEAADRICELEVELFRVRAQLHERLSEAKW